MVANLITGASVCVFLSVRVSFLLVGADHMLRGLAPKWAIHVPYLRCYSVCVAREHRSDPDGACNQHQAEEFVQC